MKVAAFISSLAGVAGSSVESAFLKEASLRGWTAGAPVSDDTRIELTFAVKQQNLDSLLEIFNAVSDPKSYTYGRHLSFDQVNELTAPDPAALAAVESMVQSLGATDVRRTPNGDFVVADVTVAAAEIAFGGNYLQFVHEDGRRVVRNPHAILPDALSAAVDFVMPLNQMVGAGGPLRVHKTDGAGLQVGGLVNTPKSLRELYNLVNETGGTAGNKQAFTGFLEQYWTNIDLQEFNKLYNQEGQGEQPARQIGDGKTGLGRIAGIEAELDVQYMMSMGLHIETEFWSFAGRMPDNDQNEPFLKWMTTLGNTSDAPLIISTSYGEDEDSMTIDYQNRCNVEFQKAGVRGISLLFASGDSGVGGAVKCSDQCSGYAQGEKCFQAMWPSASPYVTAVGGTKGAGSPEKGAGLSSGGFSYRWPMPDWQKDAVATFLSKPDQPDTSLFTTTGRGFPDISAQAVNYMVVAYGMPTPVAGTSAASPTAAGIFALVNDRRLAAGKSPLGFMNPLLYSNAGALNDVVGGHNPGCGSKGFYAVEGWDPVTGLGTPNFASLAELPAGNPAKVVV